MKEEGDRGKAKGELGRSIRGRDHYHFVLQVRLPKWRSPRAAVEMYIQEVYWRGIHTQIVVAATSGFWKVSEISRCLLDDSKCTEQVAAKIKFGRSYQIRWRRALENVEVLADKDDATPENVEVPADDE
ncbi:hypothetical protein OROMI_012289 [Orobanche minor]